MKINISVRWDETGNISCSVFFSMHIMKKSFSRIFLFWYSLLLLKKKGACTGFPACPFPVPVLNYATLLIPIQQKG